MESSVKYKSSGRLINKNRLIDEINTIDSNKLLNTLIEDTGLSQKKLSSIFVMTEKTFTKYKTNNQKLNPLTTELALKISYLYKEGIEVFGSVKNFNKWMQRPAYGLNKRIPMDLIKTSTGVDLIMEELKRIEFGATA